MANKRRVLFWIGIALLAFAAPCGLGVMWGTIWLWGERTGEPIEEVPGRNETVVSWLSILLDETGEIRVQLSGPSGQGRLRATGKRNSSDSAWDYEVLEVDLEGSGKVIDLID